jgi:type II secretory pathway pseudopilin PulG
MMKKWYTQQNQGMTFIELIVIISLFGIIASVVLFNSRDFSSNISLQNLSQDIALTIKRAQTTSASGGYNGLFVLPRKPSYGVYVNPSEQSFYYFADLDNNGQLDSLDPTNRACGTPSAGDECIEKYTISGTDDIKEVCANSKLMQGDVDCSLDEPLEVVFKRPNLDALIHYKGSLSASMQDIVDGKIVIQSADGTRQKNIIIWVTGQISVE